MNIYVASPARSWLGRVALALLGIVIVVLGFFFFAVALVAGALLAAVIGARLWWRMRKLRQQVDADIVEGEYQVVEHVETRAALPPHSSEPPRN